MKLTVLIFFILGIFSIGSVSVQATDNDCRKTEEDIFRNLDKIVKTCKEKLDPLKGNEYLWEWKALHPHCLLSLRGCYALYSLESKFSQHDYTETLKDIDRYISQTAQSIKIRLRAEEPPYTKEFCAKISADIQGLASGCHGIEVNLKEKLHEIEKQYNQVFGKK